MMKATQGIPLYLILPILFFLPSCGEQKGDPMVELNRYEHRELGIIRVCYLKQPRDIQSWPCMKGKIRFYENEKLLSFTLDRDYLVHRDSIPRGSRFTLFRNGNTRFIRLSDPAMIQGQRIAGSKLLSGQLTTFYRDGSLKSFRPAGNFTVKGIPCSETRDVELYPNGQLMVCRLHEDYASFDELFPEGSMLFFNKNRKIHRYSAEMHAAIHSHFELEKYLDENLLHVYELRMKGRTKQALTAIHNLEKEKGFNPLVYYEKSRIKRIRFLAGEPGESYESILGISVIPVYRDRHNLTFCFFDADCASWAGQGKMEEGDSLTARRYFLRAIERFETCLILDPDYQVARLSLIQLYARLPLFLGGDKKKANLHRAILEKTGPVQGARAASISLSDPAKKLDIWLDMQIKFPDDPLVNQETGRALLLCGDPRRAEAYYRKVVEDDHDQTLLLLELARAYLEATDPLGKVPDDQIRRAEACILEVLESDPAQPVIAWCFSQLARCTDMHGDRDKAKAFRIKAKQAAEFYVKGNRPAPVILYNTPGELSTETYNYFDPY